MTQGPVDMSDTTKVKNWSFPFKPKAGKLDPIQHLTAMAQASGGYYPVGANGQWHGGVHFDGKTEAVFDQSQVCCIADGEVIAYRIDTRHPESQYFTSAGASFNAVFSRSFVLVKHHLEAPAKPTAAGTAPETPPSLTFFSLYMHLLNWEGYTGTNAPNPPAFMGETLYKVKADKATDPVKGLRIRAEPRTGRVVALIPKGSKVRVGDAHPIHSGWYRLLAVVEGRTLPAVAITENMWVFPGEMEQTAEAGIFLVGEQANDLEPTLAPEKGLNVRKNGNGRRDDPIVGVLPLGATFRLESSTGTYCKLKEIVDGNDIVPLSPDSAGNIQGFVHLGSLESTRSAPKLDKVYVLPRPHPIKAGELIGHLGHYQNENERSPQRLLHLEVFSCEEVPAFIAKSQAWAAGLPDEQKTLLKVHKNASKLIPHRDDINASNPPKISDAGTTVGVDLIIPQSLLDGLPADSKLQENTTLPGSATPTTTRWWRLDNLLADNDGNPISGWLAEQDLITTRHSPWEWEGYDFIQETGSPVGKATYFYEAWRRLTNEESANYRALVSQEDQGPIKARLYDIIRPGGAKGLLTAQEISPALAKPWHAQSIAQLVTHYESEWYWKPDKWDELDPLMGHLPGIDPNLNWASEKERIKELCWWAEMAGKHGISEDGKAWHFQPAWMSEHLSPNCPEKCKVDTYELETDKGIFTVSKRLFEFILEIERYSQFPYALPDSSSGITIGYGYDLGQQTSETVDRELLGIYTPEEINLLKTALGKKGADARNHLPHVSNIAISRDNAMRLAITMKKRYAQDVVDIYPQAINLHPDCQGALLSLVINRGNSLSRPTLESRKEMAEIRDDLESGNIHLIPGRLRSMKRLWSDSTNRGVATRREREAVFFENSANCTCWR